VDVHLVQQCEVLRYQPIAIDEFHV
jgi:hypothetical protein